MKTKKNTFNILVTNLNGNNLKAIIIYGRLSSMPKVDYTQTCAS